MPRHCNCRYEGSCHDPESHRPPIRFAPVSEFQCIDCEAVDVPDEGMRCPECEAEAEENARDAWADRQMHLDDDNARDAIWDAIDSFRGNHP